MAYEHAGASCTYQAARLLRLMTCSINLARRCIRLSHIKPSPKHTIGQLCPRTGQSHPVGGVKGQKLSVAY